jgi:hypothetical protein
MVTFGGYPLRHVGSIGTQESRVIHDRLIPSAKRRSYRSDETAGGRIISISGEIRDDVDYVLRLEELRVRADDVARSLDLEDGSPTVNAKLGTVEAQWYVQSGLDRVSYSATFYETS